MLLLLLIKLIFIIMLKFFATLHMSRRLQNYFKCSKIGLTIINTDSYGVEMDLERLLQSSFPNPEDKDKIRQLFIEDVQNNILGVNSHYIGTEIHFTYPTSMIIAQTYST